LIIWQWLTFLGHPVLYKVPGANICLAPRETCLACGIVQHEFHIIDNFAPPVKFHWKIPCLPFTAMYGDWLRLRRRKTRQWLTCIGMYTVTLIVLIYSPMSRLRHDVNSCLSGFSDGVFYGKRPAYTVCSRMNGTQPSQTDYVMQKHLLRFLLELKNFESRSYRTV